MAEAIGMFEYRRAGTRAATTNTTAMTDARVMRAWGTNNDLTGTPTRSPMMFWKARISRAATTSDAITSTAASFIIIAYIFAVPAP